MPIVLIIYIYTHIGYTLTLYLSIHRCGHVLDIRASSSANLIMSAVYHTAVLIHLSSQPHIGPSDGTRATSQRHHKYMRVFCQVVTFLPSPNACTFPRRPAAPGACGMTFETLRLGKAEQAGGRPARKPPVVRPTPLWYDLVKVPVPNNKQRTRF